MSALLTRVAGAALMLAVGAVSAAAQDYPSHPLRIIVPFAAGGGGDFIVRALSDKLSESIGQQVIVENRGGANTITGTDAVAKAAPDGYTIGIVNPNFATNPALTAKALPYRTPEDFALIGLVVSYDAGMAAGAKFPANNVQELIALAKKTPGKITYASSGAGSATHLAAELFKEMAGIEMTHVPYKGAGPAMTDVLGGHVDFMFTGLSQIAPHVQRGTAKLLATSGTKRLSSTPNVPTLDEQGVKGYAASVWWGMVAPAGTPRPIVDRLHAEFKKVMADPVVVKRMAVLDGDLTVSTPEEFETYVRAEIRKWGALIKKAGITSAD